MSRFCKSLGIVLLGLGFLILAVWYGAHPRDDKSGVARTTLGSDVPPGVRFVTVALGGFRGLLADVLWVRAADLQERGRFFEVAQLADWITRLEPRYPEVWIYHAWNLSYNITAVVSDPADRWHWVMNGARLLRDEAIPANPDSPVLYWELGWMFYDKVGGRWDEATLFYRISWAREMTTLLGPGMMNYAVIAGRPDVKRLWASAGLKTEVMQAMDEAYGPFDWRLPETHALYWGYRGRPYQEAGSRWCTRLVWMALLEELKGGRLVFSPGRKLYLQGARLDVATRGIGRCDGDKVFDDPLTGLVAARFLREATVYLYAFGRKAEAEEALARLKRTPNYRDGDLALDAFVAHVVEQVEFFKHETGHEGVVGLLARGDMFRRLAITEYGDGYERLARLYWDALKRTNSHTPDWDTFIREAGDRSRREMP